MLSTNGWRPLRLRSSKRRSNRSQSSRKALVAWHGSQELTCDANFSSAELEEIEECGKSSKSVRKTCIDWRVQFRFCRSSGMIWCLNRWRLQSIQIQLYRWQILNQKSARQLNWLLLFFPRTGLFLKTSRSCIISWSKRPTMTNAGASGILHQRSSSRNERSPTGRRRSWWTSPLKMLKWLKKISSNHYNSWEMRRKFKARVKLSNLHQDQRKFSKLRSPINSSSHPPINSSLARRIMQVPVSRAPNRLRLTS